MECPGVPSSVLQPQWGDASAYRAALHHLASLFVDNSMKYFSEEALTIHMPHTHTTHKEATEGTHQNQQGHAGQADAKAAMDLAHRILKGGPLSAAEALQGSVVVDHLPALACTQVVAGSMSRNGSGVLHHSGSAARLSIRA
jgi:hypothetical protein